MGLSLSQLPCKHFWDDRLGGNECASGNEKWFWNTLKVLYSEHVCVLVFVCVYVHTHACMHMFTFTLLFYVALMENILYSCIWFEGFYEGISEYSS